MLDLIKILIELIGWPFFTVLLGFFILTIELFIFGVLMLFGVLRIRKEIITINHRIEQLMQLTDKKPQGEPEKESEKKSNGDSEKKSIEASEKEDQKTIEKRKYRYKWK